MSSKKPVYGAAYGTRGTIARALVGWFAVVCLAGAAPSASKHPQELIGPITPSIHVPPVRKAPPPKTPRIVRRRQYDPQVTAMKEGLDYRMASLRLAIEDLRRDCGTAYPSASALLRRWETLTDAIARGESDVEPRFRRLREDALLANPLVGFDALLVLKRRRGQLGLPTNHQCNSALDQAGYDNELAILSPVAPAGRLRTLFRPDAGRFVGELDLHPDGQRLLFTMPNGRSWQIHEIGVDGTGLRQVSREVADVDNFDACYLPGNRVVFVSTASYTGVPCWHGRERACCVYTMDLDGENVRQLCYDQDLDLHPSVLPTGQVIFSRWDYTGLLHAYVRPLMVMNPDGTGQKAVYGSNTYYPNCLFFPRAVPGSPNRIVAVLAGYHGKNRMGELAVLDLAKGWAQESGIVHRITHRDEPIVPTVLDHLTLNASPQFLHPYPLSDKYILTAMQPGKDEPWGIYLVDVFDNVTPLLVEPDYDFFEPFPLRQRPEPPAIPDRTDPQRDDAVIVLHDIYRGPGLRGVPRGTIKRLRLLAYHFGYPGMAGPDKVGRAGPWEVMRILGTVPVYPDGSAKFRVPANTPLAIQPLDEEGKAVQLMRSWYTAMPGETTSCIGCHETPGETPTLRADRAARMPVSEIEPWYGPARGFDFAREVQPVLDRRCTECHDGTPREDGRPMLDLRDERLVENYLGLPLTWLGATRLDASTLTHLPERFPSCDGMPRPYGERRILYTPAYEALIPFIRRVNVEDGAELLRPGEYHADTSELIQMLRKGHHGVTLTDEDWDRLVTWIDLNGPCHGSWGDIADIPENADRRRFELGRARGGPTVDPEAIPATCTPPPSVASPVPRSLQPKPDAPAQKARPVERVRASARPLFSEGGRPLTLKLGDGVQVALTPISRGRFAMGDLHGLGTEDEHPAAMVEIDHDYWIGKTEITNRQYRKFRPNHSSGFFTKRQIDRDGPGILLDDPDQPVMRVSWRQAMAFCGWLSELTGHRVTLPTEAQWEYAARAGSDQPLSYGCLEDDFSEWANLADRSLACVYESTAGVALLQPLPARMEIDDGAIGTARVASYRANPWGLHDVHGNAAEWTRSEYRPYPYTEEDGCEEIEPANPATKRVVRGGSFHDRPRRGRSAHRLAYPAWQAVHDVGFRIVVEEVPPVQSARRP